MSKAAMPIARDLHNFLRAAKLIGNVPPEEDQALLDYAGALADALAEWEDRTRFRPFEAREYAGGAVTSRARLFSPDDTDYLDLRGGLISLTTLKVGYSGTGTGSALTRDTDFWLRPEGADADAKPWTWVDFATAQHGPANSIRIDGIWGACAHAAIPEGAFNAVLRIAALKLLPQLKTAARNGTGLKRWTRGDDTKEWSDNAFTDTQAEWERDVKKAVARFCRRGGP